MPENAQDLSRVAAGLRYLLDLERRGGRLFQRDDNTIIVIDCSNFTSEQIDCVHTTYPHVQVSVLQSDASMSGFIVVFTVAPRTFKTSTGLLVLHLVAFAAGLGALWLSCAKML